jgi:hypothetical protein
MIKKAVWGAALLLALATSSVAQTSTLRKIKGAWYVCYAIDTEPYCSKLTKKEPAPPTPQPPDTTTDTPSAYRAITDRTPRPKPALPMLGPAGFAFTDPTFGSRLLRVTDAQTRPGLVNRSFRVPSNAHATVWNANSTMFYVTSTDGAAIPFAFDAATMKATRVQPDTSENGGLTIPSQVEPQFSRVDPDVIYINAGPANHTIYAFKVSTHAKTPSSISRSLGTT